MDTLGMVRLYEKGVNLTWLTPLFKWSRRWDSNPRPADYESAALPLSYAGLSKLSHISFLLSNPETRPIRCLPSRTGIRHLPVKPPGWTTLLKVKKATVSSAADLAAGGTFRPFQVNSNSSTAIPTDAGGLNASGPPMDRRRVRHPLIRRKRFSRTGQFPCLQKPIIMLKEKVYLLNSSSGEGPRGPNNH
jgi:hypothetical protein